MMVKCHFEGAPQLIREVACKSVNLGPGTTAAFQQPEASDKALVCYLITSYLILLSDHVTRPQPRFFIALFEPTAWGPPLQEISTIRA
jgi:hypothetical protein